MPCILRKVQACLDEVAALRSCSQLRADLAPRRQLFLEHFLLHRPNKAVNTCRCQGSELAARICGLVGRRALVRPDANPICPGRKLRQGRTRGQLL